jgi:hypothetical protein
MDEIKEELLEMLKGLREAGQVLTSVTVHSVVKSIHIASEGTKRLGREWRDLQDLEAMGTGICVQGAQVDHQVGRWRWEAEGKLKGDLIPET